MSITNIDKDNVKKQNLPIPAKLNIALCIFIWCFSISCLVITAYSELIAIKVLAIIGFALSCNTVYSLIHESVHAKFSPNRKINYIFGCINASLFPTSFTLQKHFHISHHMNNRTDAEMFDLYYPGDNIFAKRLQIYCILLGPYWSSLPIGCTVFCLFSRNFINFVEKITRFSVVKQTGARSMLEYLPYVPLNKIRMEAIFVILVQTGILWLINWNFLAWLGCYWSFGILWGGLQYSDHAFSKRDIRDGAWNLRVNPIIKYIYLNYHDHKAHHQNPWIPWVHLPKFVTNINESPTWLEMYIRLWCGPEEAKEPQPRTLQKKFVTNLREPINETKI